MSVFLRAGSLLASIAALCALPATHILAQGLNILPKDVEGVTITQHLDAQIPLDLEFTDSSGKPVTLGQIFDGRLPTILTMNYSDCPMLCSLQLNGLLDAMKSIPRNLGQQYQVVTVSIDPLESPERATYQAKIPGGLRPAGQRRGLALPHHSKRRPHQKARRLHRLRLQIRARKKTVHASRLAHHLHP